jgi:hypothetical protein
LPAVSGRPARCCCWTSILGHESKGCDKATQSTVGATFSRRRGISRLNGGLS